MTDAMDEATGTSLHPRTVWVLGAGFSSAMGDSMPLMDDLTEAVQDLICEDPEFKILREDPEFKTLLEKFAGQSFESLLDHLIIEAPWRNEPTRLRYLAAFHEVAAAVAEVIREREFHVRELAMKNDLEQMVEHWMTTRATVISLNYDLLIEAAYAAIYGGGSSDDLYPLSIPPIAMRGAATVGGEGVECFRLLKLHGSRHFVSPASSTGRNQVTYLGPAPREWKPNSEELEPDPRLMGDVEPIILPPTVLKSSYFGNHVVDHMWVCAGQALKNAEHVVFFGYSLPAGDLSIASMLREAIGPKVPVSLIDSASGKCAIKLTQRYEQVLGCRVKRFKGITEFDDAYPLAPRTT